MRDIGIYMLRIKLTGKGNDKVNEIVVVVS